MTSYNLDKCNFIFVDDKNATLITESSQCVQLEIIRPEPYGNDVFKTYIYDTKSSLDIVIKASISYSEVTYKMDELNENSQYLIDRLKNSINGNLKTSEEWAKLFTLTIVDPDGWDRKNFNYSWFEELITREEFERRAYKSTTEFRNWIDKEA